MPDRHSTRHYPRMLRVNEVVREALADELERMADPRLELVTITGVDVAADLRHATVYYGALGRENDDAEDGLRAAAPHLRAALGRQVRLKYLPRLEFRSDPAIETGQRVEEIIRHLHDDPREAQEAGRENVTETSKLAEAAASIANARAIALACHVNPDGDALGSMLGLFHVLRAAGLPVVASFPTPFVVAPHYRDLPGLDQLAKPEDFPSEPDVMVTFDCGSLARLADLGRPACAARELIVIDHHISNECYGTINVVEPEAAASGWVVQELIDELGLPLTRDAAVCLYAALVCDTGRFQYETTTPAVFDLARRLTEFDVPIARLSRALFEEHRFAYLKLLGEALEQAELVREQRFVWTAVTQDMLARHDVTLDEVEGLIDIVRRTSEAEVTCVLKEEPDGSVRVSLRSLGEVDVRRIAEAHGGGGHRFAAGFTSSLDIPTVVARIQAAL